MSKIKADPNPSLSIFLLTTNVSISITLSE